MQVKASVRSALQSLPAPRNDYEIVVPETEVGGDEPAPRTAPLDRADVDAREAREQEERRTYTSQLVGFFLVSRFILHMVG